MDMGQSQWKVIIGNRQCPYRAVWQCTSPEVKQRKNENHVMCSMSRCPRQAEENKGFALRRYLVMKIFIW